MTRNVSSVTVYILFITMVWIGLFTMLFRDRLNEGAQNAHILYRRRPKGYITYTFHGGKQAIPEAKAAGEKPDSMTIAGMAHCQNCIRSLISDALLTNRMAILPPPGMMLQTSHNGGMGPIDQKDTWAHYFDLSRLVEQRVIMDPTTLKYHQFEPVRGVVPGATYVEADVSRDYLKTIEDEIVAVSHFQHPKYDPNKNIKFIACDCQNYSEYIKQSDFEKFDLGNMFQPSEEVKHYANMARHDIMKDAGPNQTLVTMHVRRGDILQWEDTTYGGLIGTQLDKLTSGETMATILKSKILKNTNVTVMIFTNETSEQWMKDTAIAFANHGFNKVKFECSLDTFVNIRETKKNAFFAYEVAKLLFEKGDVRVSTVMDRLGTSTHKLVNFYEE